MSRQRDFSLNERISNIKSTLDELDMSLNPGFTSFDSSRNPSLLRKVDSVSSFTSDQSLEKFLSQPRDYRRPAFSNLSEVPENADYPPREENRPLAPQSSKWDGTFNKSSPQLDEAGFAGSYSEMMQQPASFERRAPKEIEDIQAAKDEMLDNVTNLQAELYMKLEDCQRELDYTRNYSIEQETQAALRIEELEKALEEALLVRERKDGAGESLAGKLHDAEARLAEANRRARMWEERFTHSDERMHVLEDRNRVLEERCRTAIERNRTFDVNYRKLEDNVRTLQRERESFYQELKQARETGANSDAVATSLREELRRLQQDLRCARERLTTAESVISDLQQENSQVANLSDLLTRKDVEVSQIYNEKCAADQRNAELKSILQQHEDLSQVSFEARMREAEQRIADTWSRKALILESTIAQLTAEKDNMSLELRTRPTARYVRELETKLEDLEYRVARRRHRYTSMSVTPTRSHSRSILRDNKSFDVSHKSRHSDHTVVQQLMQELKEENTAALLPRVRGLLQARKQASAADILCEKMGKLVAECTPKEAGPPTHKQIWQWVRRVVEDFMQLKGGWEQVMTVVGATNKTEVLKRVTSLAACEKLRG